jgi:hypothetical protein
MRLFESLRQEVGSVKRLNTPLPLTYDTLTAKMAVFSDRFPL